MQELKIASGNDRHASAKVAYVHSEELLAEADRNPRVPSRASMVHALIDAYGLLSNSMSHSRPIEIVRPTPATVDEICQFHSSDYVECLKRTAKQDSRRSTDLERIEDEESVIEHGFGYDCPLIGDLFNHASTLAGATIQAAERLVDCTHSIAINWAGGWHHAKKDEASGFCYVNDVVLCILRLRTAFDKVLYVDLDVHHGDAVEDAFAHTTKVMTVSFHKYDGGGGFFPGTGAITDVGSGRALYHAVNVPLKDGIVDNQFVTIFDSVMNSVKEKFRPDVVVCQCGADGLSGDPIGAFSLTENGIGQCVRRILDWQIPALFLGGGGYNLANAARCWAHLTSIIVGADENMSSDIPENEFFDSYGPGFDLEIRVSNRPNKNDRHYVGQLLDIVHENLKKIG